MSKPKSSHGETVTQCRSCPWRVGCDPERDIPNGYNADKHARLDRTIAEPGIASLKTGLNHVMACHYSEPGAEFYCAGWLHHQITEGNNLAARLGIITGSLPRPIVDGEQHQTFDATLPKHSQKRGT